MRSQTYGNGQRQTLTDTVGTLTYQWDGLDRLATLDVDGPPPAFTLGHDMNHRRIQTLTESGITEDRVYDTAGQLTALNVTRTTGGSTLSSTGYEYNTAGQRTSLTREDGTGDAFGYDNNRQVTAAHVGGTAGAALPSTPNKYPCDIALLLKLGGLPTLELFGASALALKSAKGSVEL